MDGEFAESGAQMVGFGPKQAWLAIREGDVTKVLDALALRDLGQVSWRDAVDVAYLTDDRLLFTPLLPGAGGARWLLVAGRWLLRPQVTVDVVELSWMLGTEVQFFSTYRVGEVHRWERAVDGDLVRAFAYVGETGEVERWIGEPDDAERRLGLPAELDDEIGEVLVSEHDVLRLAGAWSVNPADLDGRAAAPGEQPRAAAAQQLVSFS
jgi:hypothetical protein